MKTDPAVDTYMRALDDPRKSAIAAVRRLIREASPEICEAIKWNAPSFRTTEFFATLNLRAKGKVRIVFHTGAKVKESARTGVQVEDPNSLLEWLGKDRCMITLGDVAEIEAKGAALQAIVRAWIRLL